MTDRRRWGAPALLALLVCALPSVATADGLLNARDAAERLHTVDIEIEPGVARLQVRRTFVNRDRAPADLIVTVQLPEDGVITSVAIDAGEVEAQVIDYGEAALYLPGMPARAQRTVEYTVEVPLMPIDDRGRIYLPPSEADESLAPVLVRHQGKALQPISDEDLWRAYELPAPTPASGQLRWGAVATSGGAIWRAELDGPHVLSEPPSDPLVCFVIDRSRSQTRAGVERQLRILARWAQEHPDARYQVIAHARTAGRLFDAPVDARELLTLTADDPRLEVANGSELDAALDLATDVLADASGSAFLVVLTDAELASRLTPERMLQTLTKLSPSTTVHLLLSEGRQEHGAIEHRADDHPLASLALEHGGVPMGVFVPDDYPDPEAMIVANLWRARRIDQLRFELDGELVDEPFPEQLWEHESLETLELGEVAPQTIAAVGFVWAQPWRIEGTRSEAVDRRAAVFGADVYSNTLDDATLEQIGRAYQVATRKTALRAKRGKLAVVEPTPLGLGQRKGGGGGVGYGRRASTVAQLEPEQLRASFGAGIDACVEQHRGSAEQLSLRIETNWDEIVEVIVDGGDAATRECVATAAWQTTLDATYTERRAAGALLIERASEAGPPPIAPSTRGCRVTDEPALGASILSLLALLGLRRRRATRS